MNLPACWFACASITLLAQQPAGTAQPWRLVSEVRLVVLDVAVSDPRGFPLAGLKQEAFRVFDNGREQPLTAFAGEDAPVTVGLIVDASGSMRNKRTDLLTAVSSLLAAGNPADETFLVTFNDTVRQDLRPPFTTRPGEIFDALAGTPMEGRTALYDAIRAGLDHLNLGSRERKSLVVLSDGGDNASTTTRDETVRMAQSAQATIYTVGIQEIAQRERDPRFLRRIAYLTGGETVQDVAPARLPEVCRQIAHNIRARYTLAFRAADTAVAEHRKIRVEVSLPSGKAKVRARPGYVATPVNQTEVSR